MKTNLMEKMINLYNRGRWVYVSDEKDIIYAFTNNDHNLPKIKVSNPNSKIYRIEIMEKIGTSLIVETIDPNQFIQNLRFEQRNLI